VRRTLARPLGRALSRRAPSQSFRSSARLLSRVLAVLSLFVAIWSGASARARDMGQRRGINGFACTVGAVSGYLWIALDVIDILSAPNGERTGFIRAGDFIEELGMTSVLGVDYILHSKGCSPLTKGLENCLKPINEHPKTLWRVFAETNIRHNPDLNADLDGTLNIGLIVEELGRGGLYKEFIRHPMGWSNTFIIEGESFIVPYVPLNHAGKEKGNLSQSPLQSNLTFVMPNNPFTGESYAQSPPNYQSAYSLNQNSSSESPHQKKAPISSVQYLQLRITGTRNGMAPQLSEIHFFYNDVPFQPRSAVSHFPTKAPNNYHYAANLLKRDEYKKWYSGEHNSGSLEILGKLDFQKTNIVVEFDLKAVYHISNLKYEMKTADDCPEKDATCWDWYGSVDSSAWYLLHQCTNVDAPTDRRTNYPILSLSP